MNIKGTAKWVKLGIPKDNYDEYQGNGNKNYIIDLYVSDEDLVKFKGDVAVAYESIGKMRSSSRTANLRNTLRNQCTHQ